MRAITLGILAFALPALAIGQTDSNSLTVTASRSASLQPDQVVFTVTVTSSLNTGLEDVVAALAGSGITASDLSGVYSQTTTVETGRAPRDIVMLQWTFTLAAPLLKITETVAALNAVQQKVVGSNSGLALSYNSSGTRVSPESQAAQQCSIPELLADARAQAQKLAGASPELSVGPILALSGGTGVPSPTAVAANFAVFLPGVRLGAFLAPPPPKTCTLVVKFSLLRYQ